MPDNPRGCREYLEGDKLKTDCGIERGVWLYSGDPTGFRKMHVAAHEFAGDNVIHHQDVVDRLHGESLNGHSSNQTPE